MICVDNMAAIFTLNKRKKGKQYPWPQESPPGETASHRPRECPNRWNSLPQTHIRLHRVRLSPMDYQVGRLKDTSTFWNSHYNLTLALFILQFVPPCIGKCVVATNNTFHAGEVTECVCVQIVSVWCETRRMWQRWISLISITLLHIV